MRFIYVFFLFFLVCPFVFSQEADTAGFDSVFIIDSFDFNITGLTRPEALIRNGELDTGIILNGLPELERYIQQKTQTLYNERVLDSVVIEYFIGHIREDEKYPVAILITTKDTRNIVVIPRPMYSSNTGFDIALKMRDYNFLGTMEPLHFDIGYLYDEYNRRSFFIEIYADIPFTAFGLEWGVISVNEFAYRLDVDQHYYYKNTTGLYVELPISFTTLTVGFNESFFYNEENEDIYKQEYGEFQDGVYMSSNPYISWEIPTGVYVIERGELTVTPGISADFNHEFSKWQLDEFRKGPFLTFSNKVGFDQVDWIGNFRRGFDVYVDNSYILDFYSVKKNRHPWEIDYNISGTGHFVFTNFFGVSSRLMYRQWFNTEYGYVEAGEVIRGIRDKDLYADYILSLNMDFPLRVLKFTPSQSISEKWHIADFELHFSPIIDVALYNDPVNNISFNLKNTLVTGGFEFIAFPAFFRSLYLRVSVGWILLDPSKRNDYELYIGTDFHY